MCNTEQPSRCVDDLLRATHQAERRHFWYRGFRLFVKPFLTEATKGVSRPRILDCGCGTGANLTILKRYGRSFGFDLAWTGITFAREAGHNRVACASATQAPFPDNSFDVATSFDVLYCLEDGREQAAINEMYRLVRPGGVIIVNVPAMNMLTGNHSRFVGERRRYSRARLRRALERAGFRVERITHTNASIFLPMLAARLLQRLRGLESKSDFRVPSAPLNGLLSLMLTIEAKVLRLIDLPIGSSIVCLARKPV